MQAIILHSAETKPVWYPYIHVVGYATDRAVRPVQLLQVLSNIEANLPFDHQLVGGGLQAPGWQPVFPLIKHWFSLPDHTLPRV